MEFKTMVRQTGLTKEWIKTILKDHEILIKSTSNMRNIKD